MSGDEVVQSPGADPDTLDLEGQQLEKLSRATPELILNTTTLVLDNNNLTRLDNIHTYQCLEKLSVINNQLIRMFQVGKLHHLKVLDLSSNNIVTIEGLKDVNLLTWLSLANNNIKTIENLHQNVHLEHLDLSGNSISTITDLSFLKNLKTLMLHKNKISSLRQSSSQLPATISTLTLSDNMVTELRDISHLAHLSRLEQLSITDNPCIQQEEEIERQFDYRPYVINWCLGLRVLDGLPVGARESLKAEWMYSQSKGRQFSSGEQSKLVEYLIQTCPLDPNQETEQDRKLNLILSKVQEHQSSLRQTRQTESCYATLPRSSSSELKKSQPGTPRRNSGPNSVVDMMSMSMSSVPVSSSGNMSTPSSHHTTPVNTPGLTRRHSTGRGSRVSRSRSSPTPKKMAVVPPARYKMELPPTLYGTEDLVNGNTDLMTQSMDPSVLVTRLDNGGQSEDAMSVSSIDMMSQSADLSMLTHGGQRSDNLNTDRQRGDWAFHQSPARPRTLFSNRGSTDSGIRSDSDQLEVQDISDSEVSNSSAVLPGFTRIQSRLNPVPESLNSPDIAPGPSPPRRDDPMISGPLSSLPPDLESRLNAARQKTPVSSTSTSSGDNGHSPRPRPSDIMVAAVTARTNGAKTPATSQTVVTRPTSAVKPVNISSKVDSGLTRSGPGRTPVVRSQRSHSPGGPPAARSQRSHSPGGPPAARSQRSHSPGGPPAARSQRSHSPGGPPATKRSHSPGGPPAARSQRSHSPGGPPAARSQRSHSPGGPSTGPRQQRSHSAGPSRKNSLQNRTVASLKPASNTSSQAATPELTRKHQQVTQLALADDEASDTENELRMKNTEPVPKLRTRKSSQESGISARGRLSAASTRGQHQEMSKSSSISNLNQVRPRSTSLTRSQSQRLGGRGVSGSRNSLERTPGPGPGSHLVRPRSSTVSSTPNSRGTATITCSSSTVTASTAARSIQSGWRGHSTRTRDPEVREVKEELRSMRLEAHTKQLTKELKSARAALEQERKLRKVQSDTIKVLWKEIQALQIEQELDREFGHPGAGGGHHGGHPSGGGHHGHHNHPDRRMEREKRRLTERKLGRLIGGAQTSIYDDSDSSRGDEGLTRDQGCDSGSSVTSGDQDRNVAALSQTCVMLQSQVDTLQRNLASVIQFVSERSRHSSSSQDTPPLRSGHMMTASLDLNQQPPPPATLPSSMTMSLPPSLLLPAPVTLSKSCDSLAQTDIIAVRTPQIEQYKFLNLRKSHTDVDTSDSDHTKLDSCRSSPPRVRSPRPMTLPGVGDTCHAATPKKLPPRGSDIPGLPSTAPVPSPPGPKHVRSYASNIVDGLLSQMVNTRESRGGGDTCDEITDISMSYEVTEPKHNPAQTSFKDNNSSTNGRPGSRSSQKTVESDSLEENQNSQEASPSQAKN